MWHRCCYRAGAGPNPRSREGTAGPVCSMRHTGKGHRAQAVGAAVWRARDYLAANGVAARCDVVACDFFT